MYLLIALGFILFAIQLFCLGRYLYHCLQGARFRPIAGVPFLGSGLLWLSLPNLWLAALPITLEMLLLALVLLVWRNIHGKPRYPESARSPHPKRY